MRWAKPAKALLSAAAVLFALSSAAANPQTGSSASATDDGDQEVAAAAHAPTAAPLVAEGAAHQGYRMPGLFGFNGGRPFFAERDPLTGSLDFCTRAVTATGAGAASHGDGDYFYEDEEAEDDTEADSWDGVDRRDGPIRGSSSAAPTHNEVAGVRIVHGYSNHKYTEEDLKYPLISSSYANTKVQGTGGSHRVVRPQPTSSTPVPSYYTVRPHPATSSTTTTRRPAPTTTTTTPISTTSTTTTTTTTTTRKPPTTTTTTTTEPPFDENYDYEFYDTAPEGPSPSGHARPVENGVPSYDISHGYIYPTDNREVKPVTTATTSTTFTTTTTTATEPSTKDTRRQDSPSSTTSTTAATTTPTTTTRRPAVTYVTSDNKEPTSAPFIVTSMPLDAHTPLKPQGRPPSLTSNVILTPNQRPQASSSRPPLVPSVELQTESSYLNNADRLSPYGAYAEEPFRPIFGPGEGVEQTRPPSGTPTPRPQPPAPGVLRPGYAQNATVFFPYGANRPASTPTNTHRVPADSLTGHIRPTASPVVVQPNPLATLLASSGALAVQTQPAPRPSAPTPQPAPQDGNRWTAASAKPTTTSGGVVKFPEDKQPSRPVPDTSSTPAAGSKVDGSGSFISSVQKVPLSAPPPAGIPIRPQVRPPSTELQPPAEASRPPPFSWDTRPKQPPLRYPLPPPPPPHPASPQNNQVARPKVDTVPSPTYVVGSPAAAGGYNRGKPPATQPHNGRPRVPPPPPPPPSPHSAAPGAALPNILPQFRPTAGHGDGRFPYRQQPLVQRLQPPPMQPAAHYRRRSDRPDEEPLPPPAPLVHRRAGPDNRRITTLQMMQGAGGGSGPSSAFLPPPVAAAARNEFTVSPAASENRPVFVVYPVKPSEERIADTGVVIGSHGPQRPLPPADLEAEREAAAASEELPLLQPVRDRTDTPLLKPHRAETVAPVTADDFPYRMERPHLEEDRPLAEALDAEIHDDHFGGGTSRDRDDHDTEDNVVIPYLQDYQPFATKKPPHSPSTVGNTDRWASVSKDESTTTTATVATSQKKYPSMQETVVEPSAGGSEFTVSAVMHTRPQLGGVSGSHRSNHRERPEDLPSSSTPPSLNFQAPFQASANVDAAPSNQGWSVVPDTRFPPAAEDREDSPVPTPANSKDDISEATPPKFDFENFKPQLFGGFKPIYNVPITNGTASSGQQLLATEREERQL
ncbi:proteoglycan 4-like [Schistocerca cancellata]|uniref:proteoglycan 4-like n=1 Tax=Schistocerca cancellata TaxID=274614 RepID=UPI002118CE7A|nr:proteoglycan 4-like [Schistocerca cancellata]